MALVLLVVGGLVAGCAVNNYGALAGKMTRAGGAAIWDVYSLGAHLRTRRDDAGFNIGFTRRSYVFPDSAVGSVADGWHYFHIPMPEAKVVAMDVRSFGVSVDALPPDVGLTIGIVGETLIARIARDETVVMRLKYEGEHPEWTRLEYCRGIETCRQAFYR